MIFEISIIEIVSSLRKKFEYHQLIGSCLILIYRIRVLQIFGFHNNFSWKTLQLKHAFSFCKYENASKAYFYFVTLQISKTCFFHFLNMQTFPKRIFSFCKTWKRVKNVFLHFVNLKTLHKRVFSCFKTEKVSKTCFFIL